jgi:hypothetical protein
MDLVDEEDVVVLEAREEADRVRGLRQQGPQGRVEAAAHLAGERGGKARLSESGLAREEDMAERLASLPRGPRGEGEVLDGARLADDLGEGPRAVGNAR